MSSTIETLELCHEIYMGMNSKRFSARSWSRHLCPTAPKNEAKLNLRQRICLFTRILVLKYAAQLSFQRSHRAIEPTTRLGDTRLTHAQLKLNEIYWFVRTVDGYNLVKSAVSVLLIFARAGRNARAVDPIDLSLISYPISILVFRQSLQFLTRWYPSNGAENCEPRAGRVTSRQLQFVFHDQLN